MLLSGTRNVMRPSRRNSAGLSQRQRPGRLPRVAVRAALVDRGTITIATRGSPLALEQATQVKDLLAKSAEAQGLPLKFELKQVESAGDKDHSSSLRQLGSGAFTAELDAAVSAGEADLAVHSLKDAPVHTAEGLVLAACLPREDARDVMIAGDAAARSIKDLKAGTVVGTGSMRRRAQILHANPKLKVVPIRGSVDERLRMVRVEDVGATVLAYAGLKRLGKESVATAVLSIEDMLPAACQGIIGVMCRKDDRDLRGLLGSITDEAALMEATAERACLACVLPQGAAELPEVAVAVHARYSPPLRTLGLDCLVGDVDGKQLFRYTELSRQVRGGVAEDAQVMGEEYGMVLAQVAQHRGWIPSTAPF